MTIHRIPLFLCILACLCTAAPATDLKPEEVLSHHLESIGTAEVRGAKSRVVEGTASYSILVGGSGRIEGNAVLLSEEKKLHLMLKVNALQYHGERFISDGHKTFVVGTYADHSRSEFGEFLRSEDSPLREGLLGGVWSTAWPLLHRDDWEGRINYKGMKKVEGRELYAIAYRARKNPDLEVTLYFDPQSFHHVMTLYKASVHAGIRGTDVDAPPSSVIASPLSGGAEIASARQQQTRYQIEERFSDFKRSDDLTLPSQYELRFTEELQNGFTKTVSWNVIATRVLNNIEVNARNFDVP